MGSYHYAAGSDAWQWSDGVYAIHGFRRGEVVPTTALLLAHAHSADRRHAARLFEDCLHGGELFSFLYRVVDAGGKLRWALIAGEGTFDADGAVTGIRGYLIDVTEPRARARSQEVASAMRKAIASRATIEQAKGALMLVYGLDAEAAFALLSWQSQHSNIKLRDLADRLVAAVGGDAHASAGIRQRLDEIVYSLPAGPAPAAPSVAARGDDDLLTVEQQRWDEAVVLRLGGEIDMATGPRLDKYLADAVAAAIPPAPVVVDLTNVQHLGSVGVALLTSYHRRCQISGIPLRVVVGDGPVAGILTIAPTGLELHERVSDALAPSGGSDPAGPPPPEVPAVKGQHPDDA
jgi:anti-anti-sigma factor